jgi:hypothetical protein
MSIDLARQLIERLERLSVDSAWAHQASGVKGSLLRYLEMMDGGDGNKRHTKIDPSEQEKLDQVIKLGFDILNEAAAEIKTADEEARLK